MSIDKPCVLVVEDEPAQREVLVYNLEAEGYEVFKAENGEEAIELIKENPKTKNNIISLHSFGDNLKTILICKIIFEQGYQNYQKEFNILKTSYFTQSMFLRKAKNKKGSKKGFKNQAISSLPARITKR